MLHGRDTVKFILRLLIGISVIALGGCGSPEDPQFRISNQRATKANLQVQTSGGNTININDVQPSQTTAFRRRRSDNRDGFHSKRDSVADDHVYR